MIHGPGMPPLIPERLFGIIGYPLRQSLSPAIHNQAFHHLGLPYVYCAWPLRPESVECFLHSMALLPISGCSVTIPHKQQVVAACSRLSVSADRIGAVNTLYWEEGKLCGENTDCLGFQAPLLELEACPGSAVILGTGGAARACIVGLQECGVRDISVAGRDLETLEGLRQDFRIRTVVWEHRLGLSAEMLVNCTPLGMAGPLIAESPYPGAALGRFRVVYDLVYNPLWTKLLVESREAGCCCISGVEMFVNQAAAQFRLWTGHHMPMGPARRRIRKQLSP